MSETIFELLRRRFAPPMYAYLEEVRNGTGFTRRQTRTADALAYCTWPSRGLELHGVEVKTSRSDWIRERDDPAKSAEIQRFCDRWWLAVGNDTIIQPGELPPMWGLLVQDGGKLVVVAEAPKLEAVPLDRLMLASILRNVATTYMPRSNIARELEAARSEATEAAEKRLLSDAERLQRELDQLRGMVKGFEQAAGVSFEVWRGWNGNAKKIGDAVRFILAGGIEKQRQELQDVLATARRITGAIERELADTTERA